MLNLLFIVLSLFVSHVLSHSFMECSDYRGTINGQDYDDNSCEGYPRYYNYALETWPNFGTTGGKSNAISGSLEGVDICKWGITGLDTDYDDERPYAHYTVGSTIRLVWPAKNHANYECKSYSADHGMVVYALPQVNPTTDSTSISEWITVIDWHQEYEDSTGFSYEDDGYRGIDGVPFTNCPGFCEETDNAPCFGDFELTTDIYNQLGGGDGIYTFVWVWAFGSANNYYTTCWEANVTSTGEVSVITDDGNGNEGDESSSEEIDPTEQEYQFTIPVCYINNGLDTTLLMNGFNTLANLDIFNNEVEFTLITSLSNGLNTIWNASIQSNYVNYDYYVLLYLFIDNGTLCMYIENEFNNIGECSICGGASAHSDNFETNVNNNDDNNSASGAIWGIGITLLILLIAAIVGYQYYMYNNSNGKANSGNNAAHTATAINNHPNTQSNIVPASTNGARPAGRPPRPPPPRPTHV